MDPHPPKLYRPSPLRAATSASLSSARSESPDHEKVEGDTGRGTRRREDGDRERDVREYAEMRDRYARAIESAIHLISDLRNFNGRDWDIRYPLLRPILPTSEGHVPPGATDDAEGQRSSKGKGKEKDLSPPDQIQRAFSLPDEPSHPRYVSLPAPPAAPTASSSAQTSTPEISHMINSAGAINDAASITGREGAVHATRRQMARSVTMLPGSMTSAPALGGSGGGGESTEIKDDATNFSILRLDLSLGHQPVQSNSTTPDGGLMQSLTRTTISTLISTRLTQSLSHLQMLATRIASTSSRVLVTGDLNAGKSTLVNALLRRGDEVMPVDQQPLTGRFVEVFGDDEIGTLGGVERGRREEVHVPKVGWEDEHAEEEAASIAGKSETEEIVKGLERAKSQKKELQYDRDRAETYEKKELSDLYQLVVDQEATSPPLKVYLRAPPQLPNTPPSILHNGILDISLIDAPGLNRDILQTTSNFASSSSIDVIVFVVSASNHFTLSAKEFILSAGQEKARMFVVVNRFDEVRDKERCKRLVLEQVKKLSPGTWDDREELVHFVDSAKVAYGCCEDPSGGDVPIGEGSGGGGGGSGGGGDDDEGDGEEAMDEAFKKLEQSLRSFVLINRAKSKLGPAENYLKSLLKDVKILAAANVVVAEDERDKARAELNKVRPVLEGMQKNRHGLDEGLEEVEDKVATAVLEDTKSGLQAALEKIGQGQLAVENGHARLWMPTYPGLLGVWDYAIEVRKAMLKSVDLAVVMAEDVARKRTSSGVEAVWHLGDVHLPTDVERSKRVFNPEAMFSVRPSSRPSTPSVGRRSQFIQRRSSNFGTVGLGLSTRADLTQVSIVDLFDIHHYLTSFSSVAVGKSSSSGSEMEISTLGFASIASAGGAVAAFSGKAIGLSTAWQNLRHLTDFLDSDSARKYAAPVAGAVFLGLVAYIVYDLPRSIPKNVGRHIRAVLLTAEQEKAESSGNDLYIAKQAIRIQREARKVVKIASWDLKERFHDALESRGKAVKDGEENERKSDRALQWFHDVDGRVDEIQKEMGKSVML